ncbi:MAG: hybrid sensor histidine kinase/response regulator [Myxococcota bacterium]|nr:hybrid sensor histidine kinase/response regulator [Myxococcota bacterium]
MSLVLVADDEPAVLDALSGVVEDLGHEVVQAKNGQEALELTRRRRPRLVITDHMMPHLSGIELCRTLKADEALRKIPVILLSGATDHGTPAADAFLPKPFELAEFETLIHRLLQAAPPEKTPATPPPAHTAEQTSALMEWMAHELRTPLSAARIQVHLLEKHTRPDTEAKLRPFKGLRRQLASLELLAGVISDAGQLLGQPLRLTRAATPMVELVQGVVEAWRERLTDRRIELRTPPAELELSVDAARISRALEILIGNAVKHGPKEQPVEVVLELADPHLAIQVTDRGQGIGPEKQETLFAGFRPGQGSGQGMELYVASEVARAHGGGITVRSAKGEGATFTLSLPRQ